LARATTLAIFPVITLQVKFNSFSKIEEANVNISLSTVVPSTKLLEERAVPMDQPDGVPVVVGYADSEDEEDEEDDLDDDEDDFDDLDDEEDEEEDDDEDLDHEWEEVEDDDDEDEDDDEEDEAEDEE